VCAVSRLPQLAIVVGTLAGVILLTLSAAGTFLLVHGVTDPATGTGGAFRAPGGATEGRPAAPRADLPSSLPMLAMPDGATGPTATPGPGHTAGASPAPGATSGSAAASGSAGRAGDAAAGEKTIELRPPTLVAIAPRRIGAGHLRRLRALRHVRGTVTLGGGAVRVSGTTLNLLAVPVERFRAWTPAGIADRPEPWDALRRGEFVAEAAAARRLGLVPGAHYQLDQGPRLRLAAAAAIGLPGVDGYVSEETGRRLGLTPGVVVLVHGPVAQADALARQTRGVLGSGTQVVLTASAAVSRPARQVAAEPPARSDYTGRVGRPDSYIELYRRSAALCPGLSWTVLAAIGQVESGHGRNNGPSSAGALGPMQFMPATWRAYGVDGDGDGKADIWSPYDAVPSAANYLCANGAGQGGEKLRRAVWHYNHSWSYVAKVLSLANAYAAAYPD